MRSIPEVPAVIGAWYRRLDRDQPFQVVACDVQGGTVDVEYYDGTIDEWPMAHWRGLEIVPCEQPQDSSGPFDTRIDGMAPEDDDTAGGSALDLDEAVSRASQVTADPDR